jgi:signal transduction histidine kinase
MLRLVGPRPAPPAGSRLIAALRGLPRSLRGSIFGILAASLLLVALVPFLPLTLLTLSAYHRDVESVESEISASNRQIAVIAGNFLDVLLRQIREEGRVADALATGQLPPPLAGVAWELVSEDGTVLESQLDADRRGRDGGYRAALPPGEGLTIAERWLGGDLPRALYAGPVHGGRRLVAVLDPVELNGQLQAWTREGHDRHLYVVEGSGRPLFYSDLELSRHAGNLAANPPVRRLASGLDGAVRYVSVLSGKQRLGYVHRLAEADWAVVVSADVGASLLGLRGRYALLGWSIAFALAAAVAILLLCSRWLARPLLDIRRALHDPDRSPHEPLEVEPSTRRVAEYDELVTAFDELGADFTAVERELVQAEKTSLLGQLASGLAHEMGTPLNVITGNAQYLLRKVPPDDPRRPVLEQIVSQAQRIAAMIRRLLDVSRPAEARLVPVDVAAVVRQTLEIVPGLSRNVEVRCDLDPDLGPVLADPKLLEHALMNLIVNACQAMPNGGRLAVVTGAETVTDASVAPAAVVIVSDTGCGIPPENLPRIFEPFFTTKPHPEGTGLGLAIVERIVRQHGGRVEVQSAVGRGTAVVLRLRPVPLASAEPRVRHQEGR